MILQLYVWSLVAAETGGGGLQENPLTGYGDKEKKKKGRKKCLCVQRVTGDHLLTDRSAAKYGQQAGAGNTMLSFLHRDGNIIINNNNICSVL